MARRQVEGHGWWSLCQPSQRFLAVIRTLLPKDESWGETEEYVSAQEWGSDLRVWRTDGKVCSVVFRFAPGADEWSLMSRFLALVREEKGLLLDPSTRVVFEPDEAAVLERLRTSRAMHFLRDPESAILAAAHAISAQSGTRIPPPA